MPQDRPARQPGSPATAALDAELARIRALSIDELRDMWRSMTHRSAPKALSRDLLARLIAHRLQEQHIGKLDRALCQVLDRLAKGKEPVRRLKIGTVLVREHRDTLHEVIVVPGGFCWQGKTYASLSTIARAITGTSWNGPRFFGLRGKRKGKPSSTAERATRTERTPRAAPRQLLHGSVRPDTDALRLPEVQP
jgi:hypothetical protein